MNVPEMSTVTSAESSFAQVSNFVVSAANSIAKLLEKIDSVPYDTISISQESLDLANKFRTSIFPWRGQFSPELVELFLNKYAQHTSVILDPFAGSGTTLFEAARKSLTCYAVEINPSAIEMARTAHFTNLPLADRKSVIQIAEVLAEECIHPFTWDLFSYQNHEQPPQQLFSDSAEISFRTMLKRAESKPLVYNILANSIIRYMNYSPPHVETDFLRALQEHAKIIKSLPYSKRECKVFHADARAIPLPDATIDLVITSPPYINVFNYHQNNRPAMELIGWDLLDIAKSEIGSNRKNRQNRFLTVVQYTLDMLDALKEIRRLLRPDGRVILVVGRESNIRGLSFKNGMLVAAIALGGAGFHLETRQERKFKNKFGEVIYEDILHLVPIPDGRAAGNDFARSLAKWSLLEASKDADEQVRQEALEAKERAGTVQKSPIFKLSATHYQVSDMLKEENISYEVRDSAMRTYPTPHLEKLKATLVNEKLPPDDKPQVEKAIEHYEQWVANMEITMEADLPADERLERMVNLLNEYRKRMDIDLIFDSQDDWLYRQKGQIKLDNSIIEEFLPRLIHPTLIPEISAMNVTIGPIKAFSAIWFDSSLIQPAPAGGLNIRTKDQDFAISKPLYLKASHSPDFEEQINVSTNLAYIAAECKTNLDKTMFQEACATARDLKSAIPGAKYYLLCEWLDMTPVSSRTTPIDEVLLLREAKRISSNIRQNFSTYKGRQEAREPHLEFLNKYPYRAKVFERFIGYIQQLVKNEPVDEQTVLERGYF